MHPDQSPTLAPPERPMPCGYCPKKIIWLPSFIGGHNLCFDATPIDRIHDHAQLGWLQAPALIGDTLVDVYMPWPHAPHPVRRRTTHVRRLHECSGDTWRAA